MKWTWPWHRRPAPAPVVTNREDRELLTRFGKELAERARRVDERGAEVRENARYLRDQHSHNHIAERFRSALQGR